MKRIIPVCVSDEFVEPAGLVIGAAGSHNDVQLELNFSPLWRGRTIKATWKDARGENPTVIPFLPAMLEPGFDNVYLLDIPYSAKKIAGMARLTIEGKLLVEGQEVASTLTTTSQWRVMPSDGACSPEIDPSVADLLQAGITKNAEDIAANTSGIEAVQTSLDEHKTDPDAHPEIRQEIVDDIAAHNADPTAHQDMREDITLNRDAAAAVAAGLFAHASDTTNPHKVTAEQIGAMAREDGLGLSCVAVCEDVAAPPTSTPNTWYIPKTMPKPTAEAGLMVDVFWVNGHVGGLGYNVSLVWGEPGGADNEVIISGASVTDSLTGEVSIPTEGTIRYQLIDRNGRLTWKYVSGKTMARQYSTNAAASAADKPVHSLELEYLPGMEIYVQIDKGNTAPLMRLAPDSGPTLPVYGNGKGNETGGLPAGYICHLVNAEDHWQLVNTPGTGGGGGGGAVDSVNGQIGAVVLTAADVGARPDSWHPVRKTVIAPHGSETKADMTASEIIDATRAGIVQAEYTDPVTGELRTYQYFKQTTDGRAVFAVNGYIENGVPKQTLIYVDYAGNVTTETREPEGYLESPAGGTAGDFLTLGADGQPVWTTLENAAEVAL